MPDRPETAIVDEPHAHHRPEQRADAARAVPLDREQRDEDDERRSEPTNGVQRVR